MNKEGDYDIGPGSITILPEFIGWETPPKSGLDDEMQCVYGYKVRIAQQGQDTIVHTQNPVTGKRLTTMRQCLAVCDMYIGPLA